MNIAKTNQRKILDFCSVPLLNDYSLTLSNPSTGSTGKNLTLNNQAEQVMIKLPDAGGSKMKSLNAPSVLKVQELVGLRVIGLSGRDKCKECGISLNTQGHFM